MLLLALHRGAVPLQLYAGQHFSGSQRVIHQRHSLVQSHGEDEGFVGTLAGRLTRLRISGYRHHVFELLNQHFVFVAFHIDVTDGVGGEGTGSDVTLGLTVDADIAGRWHDLLLDRDKGKCPKDELVIAESMPLPDEPFNISGLENIRYIFSRQSGNNLLGFRQDIAYWANF